MALDLLIKDWMGSEPVTITAEETIGRALELMLLHDVRHLPVVELGQVAGIVSDRDIGQLLGKGSVALDDQAAVERYLARPIRQVMTTNPVTISASTSIETAVEIMMKRKIGALPVVGAQGALIGIFTQFDAMRVFLHLLERCRAETAPSG